MYPLTAELSGSHTSVVPQLTTATWGLKQEKRHCDTDHTVQDQALLNEENLSDLKVALSFLQKQGSTRVTYPKRDNM